MVLPTPLLCQMATRISSSPSLPRLAFRSAVRADSVVRPTVLARFRPAPCSPSLPSRRYTASALAFTPPPSSLATARSQPALVGLPRLSHPSTSTWLLATSFLTFSIIVVGGLTRLTESGLSITEWDPITGTLPPLSPEQWQVEFDKYRASEEGKRVNKGISMDDFKFIFLMEWAHRNLGRLIGLAVVGPGLAFAARKMLSRRDGWKALALATGVGFQGFLGWYMVASGLDSDHLSSRPNDIPRVSQYRLAAHLGAALVLYTTMIHTALTIRQEWKVSTGAQVAQAVEGTLLRKRNLFRRGVWGLSGLVLFTAVSGAFVAGLDAGLIYNEFPEMGEGIVPPLPELYNPKGYARRADGKDGWWRNMLENPTTVQFDHRVLAMTTATAILVMTSLSHSSLFRASLPRSTRRLASLASLVVLGQVTLGVSTLLYLVPTPLAAAHQAGSVVLLTTMMGLIVSLRRPTKGALAWRGLREAGLKLAGGGRPSVGSVGLRGV